MKLRIQNAAIFSLRRRLGLCFENDERQFEHLERHGKTVRYLIFPVAIEQFHGKHQSKRVVTNTNDLAGHYGNTSLLRGPHIILFIPTLDLDPL